MALSWNEIRKNAIKFSNAWATESKERAEAQTFWNQFFEVFGNYRRRMASFEEPVKKLGNKKGFIDLFWKGTLIVESKTRGVSLDSAYEQALEYFPGLKEEELPKYVIVTDFEKMRIIDIETNEKHEFLVAKLHENIKLFSFIAGYTKTNFKSDDPVNIKAAELMGELYDSLLKNGYLGHPLEQFMVRILFCLFADNTGIFEKGIFEDFIRQRTKEDGSDLGGQLALLFQVLNTPSKNRFSNLDEDLNAFEYIDGKLFEENIAVTAFDSAMREALLKCCHFDWSLISPAIFGSLFQSIKDKEARRNLGEHYTSESNILKVIRPLFLDDLYEEFNKIKNDTRKLVLFHKKIAALKFFDPACGCGNFLIVTYRELRLLEIEILKRLHRRQTSIDIANQIKLNVDSFYGIEIEEFPARIAEVALWLVDHQMNMKVSEELGNYFKRIPLEKVANITVGNALRLNWEEIIPKNESLYILGNPPFIGHHLQTSEQKEDLHNVLKDIKAAGVMDYVSAWFHKAAEFIQNTKIKVGLVSTNSITQGEQVGILWSSLLKNLNVKIHFAHRTFKWSNEARGKAAVFCVIIGFGNFDISNKKIYEYENVKAEPHLLNANNINPYLIDSNDCLIINRNKPICDVPKMVYGSKPTDGGNFLLTTEEKDKLINIEPKAKKYIKEFISSKEYLHGNKRWCLWLLDVDPKEIRLMPEVLKRVELVKKFRLNSKAKSTREYTFPTLFRQITQPKTDYIIIPRTTSEKRKYIPLGFISKEIIVSDTCFSIGEASLYHFGVLSSEMHMTWMRYVCGRLKSDYRYSKDIVYNNFPWPENITEDAIHRIEKCVQEILKTRKEYVGNTLADLYDPLTMPPKLIKAHQELDKLVDKCYRNKPFESEEERMEFLFDLYQKIISKKEPKIIIVGKKKYKVNIIPIPNGTKIIKPKKIHFKNKKQLKI